MKLGYVIHRFPWPSETFISREVGSLLARGHNIEIYAFEKPEGRDFELLTPDARALVERTQYISRAEAARALVQPSAIRMLRPNARFQREATVATNEGLRLGRAAALLRRARRDRLDCLHAHWPYATQIVHLVSEASGLPYSVSIHAHEVAHDNGHFAAAFERLKFATFCNRAAMEYLFARLPDEARAKGHLVYHGVNTSAFAALPPPKEVSPLRVLSAGRVTPTKGFDRLIRGCARAAANGVDVELTILGRGPLSADLEALATELGFQDRLHLPGWVPHDQVREHLSQSHVFALLAAADFNDGLPNVVLEAMACARPVILSPLPAAREAVRDSENGYVLDAIDDYVGLENALRRLANPEVAAQMGLAARQSVIGDHDADVHIGVLADLLGRAYA